MTTTSLPAALRAAAEGLYAIEAATGLFIAHGTWLHREDFSSRVIYHGTRKATVGGEAAVAALDAGELPGSGGERRMLRLAASLGDHATVSLGEAITGIDERNVGLLISVIAAVLHASGRRQFPDSGRWPAA